MGFSFRSIYVAAFAALVALSLAGLVGWGPRAAAGVAAGGAISISVLASWQWAGAWMAAGPRSALKRRLILVWPLKYGAIAAALWALLRGDLVSPVALIVGLGLVQAVIFGRALGAVRPMLADLPPRNPESEER